MDYRWSIVAKAIGACENKTHICELRTAHDLNKVFSFMYSKSPLIVSTSNHLITVLCLDLCLIYSYYIVL